MSLNVKNRTLFTGDNLDVMRGVNSDSVDLIYLDPPFNSNKNYSAPVGSEAAGAAFKDTWTLSDVDIAWIGIIAEKDEALAAVINAAGLSHGKGMKSYLTMMAVRLLEMKLILKPTGSIYLHCDPTASHYLKLVMDCVFGTGDFRNELIWHYKTFQGQAHRCFAKKHDTLLVYGKGAKFTYNEQFDTEIKDTVDGKRWARYINSKGQIRGARMPVQDSRFVRYLNKWIRKHGRDPEANDVVFHVRGQPVDSVWNMKGLDPKAAERLGYPTQKPLGLLERIIKASSNEGDVVLDPFCGCATALVAAEILDRQWIGIDLSSLAVKLVVSRLQKSADDGALLGGGRLPDVHHRTDFPQRTDIGKLPPYKTHRHTLYGKQEGRCGGCRHHFPFRNLTVDHIVARSKGGTDHLDNLQLLCNACNSTKGTIDQAAFVAKLKTQGII